MIRYRSILACVLWIHAAVVAQAFDYGLFGRQVRDAEGNERLHLLGPFFEKSTGTNGVSVIAVRPFYAHYAKDGFAREGSDYLWPIASSRTLEGEAYWRFLFWLGFSRDRIESEPRERRWLFPFYFSGRDATGGTYRAVFPIGGTVREFMGRDEIRFVLFPLYSSSRINDLRTRNVLWPIASRTTGDGTARYRVFPFYGYSYRKDRFEKRFVLWPFWTSARYIDPETPGSGYMLWPIIGHVSVKGQETWWVAPPLFKFAESETYRQINAPWPFFQYARSRKPGEEEGPLFGEPGGGRYAKLYCWPFWGRRQLDRQDRSFVAWPFIWWSTLERKDGLQSSFTLAPLWHASAVRQSGDTVRARSNRFWPLYSYRRTGEDAAFRTLELWPFAPSPAVERNWAPLWSLISYERSGAASDWSVLWGLYHREHRAEASRVSLFPLYEREATQDGRAHRWSVLKGLMGRERSGDVVQWRVLYIPFGEEGIE